MHQYKSLQTLLLIAWPFTATAAQLSFSRSLYTTDVILDLALTFGISLLVGLSALLAKMKVEYKENGHIDQIYLMMASNIMNSIVAGMVMYFASDALGLPRAGTVISIIFASWLGTAFMERGTTAFLDWLSKKFVTQKAQP